MLGPVFNVRFLGLFCPCFEDEENKSARVSLNQLNRLGNRVDWHSGGDKGGARGFVQNLFNRQHANGKLPTPSQLRLVDGTKEAINAGNPFPELQIKPSMELSLESSKKGREKKMTDIRLDIPLHHIERIESIEPTMLVIITKDVHSTDENRTTKEAARLSWESSDDRDSAMVDLKVLVEWNKHRQPEFEEEFAADGIKVGSLFFFFCYPIWAGYGHI
jgi:hypothetical protein